jgi:hypothetical protein
VLDIVDKKKLNLPCMTAKQVCCYSYNNDMHIREQKLGLGDVYAA